MKVIVMSKTSFNVIEYNDVTSIAKAASIVTIYYGVSSSAVYNSADYIVRIIES